MRRSNGFAQAVDDYNGKAVLKQIPKAPMKRARSYGTTTAVCSSHLDRV